MKAIILAGGYGNRLKPLTETMPKPMLSICNRPMIDYCVAQLAFYGIKEIVFSLGYKPEKIVEWAVGYGDSLKVEFSIEDMPLGTLGGVKAAAEKLTDVFVVTSGDGLSDIDLNAMLNRHLATKAVVTMAVKEVNDPSLYGVAELGADGFIKGFIEKPHGIKRAAFVNCGTYIINKSALGLVQRENCDFAKDLFPILVNEGRLAYYKHNGYWRDIGDFASYYHANFDLLSNSFFPYVENLFAGNLKSRLVKNSGEQDLDIDGSSFDNSTVKSMLKEFRSGIGYDDSSATLLYNNAFISDAAINESTALYNEGTAICKKNLSNRVSRSGCLVAESAHIRGSLYNSIVGQGCMITAGSALNHCLVLDGAKVFGRHDGCIFAEGGVRLDILNRFDFGSASKYISDASTLKPYL